MGKRAEAGIFIEEIEAGSLSGCKGKEVILERYSVIRWPLAIVFYDCSTLFEDRTDIFVSSILAALLSFYLWRMLCFE